MQKNAAPIRLPPGVDTNAVGKVWKNRPAPAVKSSPYVNTIGKIARPAASATSVSQAETTMADRGMLIERGR